MACGNNNNRGGNLGGLKNILDFNVTYTGCETSCGGREIKTGDSLRNVLDALVANCDGGSGPVGSSTNFWFSRNVPTFTADVKENDFALTGAGAIYEFIDGEWQNTGIQIGGGGGGDSVWGQITGAIADQTDLTEYINLLITEAPLPIDKFGENFHKKDGDEKIHLGRVSELYEQIGADYTNISTVDLDLEDLSAIASLSVVRTGELHQAAMLASHGINLIGGTTISLDAQDIGITAHDNNPSSISRFSVRVGSADFNIIRYTGQEDATIALTQRGGTGSLRVYKNESQMKGGSGYVTVSDDTVSVKQDAGTRVFGLDIIKGETSNDDVIELFRSSGGTARNAPMVKYAGTAEITLTDDRQLAHKKYVDDLIAAQAATIADLTARIEALENA